MSLRPAGLGESTLHLERPLRVADAFPRQTARRNADAARGTTLKNSSKRSVSRANRVNQREAKFARLRFYLELLP